MTTWHKGPPPSIGWWPASNCRSPKILRWWNGKVWSFPAGSDTSKEAAAELAEVKAYDNADIEWTDRPASWPARSRT
jgi:hypothetical protein